MIAAIYARKSTEQNVVDDQKSVTRQIAHGREYATRKGWSVDDAYVFVDDGISGAEFAKRPGFVRLMSTLAPHPPFQILVMAEESRRGRESIETAYALKQLISAGVRVFFYLALPGVDWRLLDRQARRMLGQWRELLTDDVADARRVLRELLEGPLRFTPLIEGAKRGYRFEGVLTIGGILGGRWDGVPGQN